jgi:hypothetical protein
VDFSVLQLVFLLAVKEDAVLIYELNNGVLPNGRLQVISDGI